MPQQRGKREASRKGRRNAAICAVDQAIDGKMKMRITVF
jgi:hypothetical protein